MEEINLYDLLRFYAKKWLIIVSFAIAGAIIGLIYTYYIQQPTYKSSATILLVGTNRTAANQESVVLNNYVQLFTSHRVLDPVIEKADYDKGYDTLVADTTAENAKNTDIIDLSISTSKAKTSKALLDNAIQEFGQQAKELYGDNSVRISVVDAASLPGAASNIKPVQQIGIATIAAAVLAIIGLFFAYDYRHSNLKKEVVAAEAEKPAKKPKAPKQKSKRPVGKALANMLLGDDTKK